MGNQYFQFKQFTIHQDRTAMKVCTDACLFGAWVVHWMKQEAQLKNDSNVLDIGTGTGLLSLMIAQETGSIIDAIEIDASAAQQAGENVATSKWQESIRIINTDITAYNFEKSYQLIISNPPFYENDLKSGNLSKDRAMHDTGLTMQQLVEVVHSNLGTNGYFAVLLPFHRMSYMRRLAADNQLKNIKQLLVKPTPKHSFTRAMLLFQKQTAPSDGEPVIETLIIKEVHHSYSLPFIDYLQPYYLSL